MHARLNRDLSKTAKITLVFQALFTAAFLYIAYNTLFFEIQNLYSKYYSLSFLKEQQSSPLLLLCERLLYAFVHLGGGWLFFYKLFAPAQPSLALKLKDKRMSTALLWALAGGFAAFALVFLLTVYGGSIFGFEQKSGYLTDRHSPLREMLQRDSSLLLWHLLFSALLTAIIEETYYRACLQNYLQSGLGPFLSISISAFIFALAHGEVIYFMLWPAFVFSILFWKQGLVSAIVAHTLYNALILLVTSRGY